MVFDQLSRDRLSRRALIAALPLSLAGACARKRANRYAGLMFVASRAERAVAVADLSDFRRVGTIRTGAVPQSLVRTAAGVCAICSWPAVAVALDPGRLAPSAKLRLPARPVTATATGNGRQIAVLATDPNCVLIVSADLNHVLARIPLPGRGEAMDVWGERAAVSIPSARSIARISLPNGQASHARLIGQSAPGAAGAPLRFRADGNTLLMGDPARREIVTLDWRTGALETRLPVPVEPDHFCFNDNGGQMFVSGAGADAVAIVAPYQNEVYETIPAGRAPGAMATSDVRKLLLICNPSVGDLTILNIETRSLAASVHVGDTPTDVLVTPDGEYAMTINSGSGSVAVIRLSTVLNRGQNGLTARGIKPLFTMFPMITAPEGATILPTA
jgi:hypothetical protein